MCSSQGPSLPSKMVDISPGNSFSRVRASGRKDFSVVKKWRGQEGKPLSRRRQTQSRPNAVEDSSIVSFTPESISPFHVPFFLFFPFRHLLPQENCTIRGRAQSQNGPLGPELLFRHKTLGEDGHRRRDPSTMPTEPLIG